MKLFVDDLRKVPSKEWVLARTITEAIRILETGYVEEISLDFDIIDMSKMNTFSQENYGTVARYIAIMRPTLRPHTVFIHTANPSGAEQMVEILQGKVKDIIRVHCPISMFETDTIYHEFQDPYEDIESYKQWIRSK